MFQANNNAKEFVATDPCHRIYGTHQLRYLKGDRLKNAIANGVAIKVVNRFKLVQIKIKASKSSSLTNGCVQCNLKSITQKKSVWQTGEWIVASAEAQLIQEQAQADVAAREAKTMPNARVTDLYLRKPQVMSAKAALKSAQAQLKIAKRDLENCKVKAPYDALVVSRGISTGDYVTQGTPVAVINNIEYAEVTFPVAGFDRVFLADNTIGSEIAIEVDDIQGATVKGTIHRDTGVIDNNTRMSYFVARIEDPYAINSSKPIIKFGSYSTIAFEGKTLSDVYRIPQELITNRLLWTLDDEDRLTSQKVTVVREENGDFLIQGDFNANKVVMSLPEYPQNGMPVKVIETTTDLVTASAN